jgi:homocysteine S-methyltransferase
MTPREHLTIADLHVLDGGLASELEFRGADISGPLWSAHVLESAPEQLLSVHRAYVEAGADVLLSASYQVSRQGYREIGLTPDRADQALRRAVEFAREAAQAYPSRKILVAASLGPYGAVLHNGAEYHGNYPISYPELVQFHAERIAVLAETSADLLAFETLPSLEEARAIGEALQPWPHLAAWFAFNCPDTQAEKLQVAHGEPLRQCASLVAAFPQTIAIGINCTHPRWIASLIPELRQASDKSIVVYPNSGELWNADSRCWTGPSDPESFADLAHSWRSAGAQLIGGCCRTRPTHIQQIAQALSQP